MNLTVESIKTTHHQALWALLIYSLLALLFCYPVLLGQLITQSDYLYFISPWDALRPESLSVPGNPYLQDQSTEFLAFFLAAKAQIQQVIWPLWNPYIFAGTPLLANTQSALLFPLNWGHFVLPAGWGFTVSVLLKLTLAGWFTYLYARRMQLMFAPALLAGVAFSFCTFNIFWLNHPHTNVAVLIPLCFYAIEGLLYKTNAKQMVLLALVIALSLFAGHVEIAFLTALACGLYLVVRAWQLKQHSMRLWALFSGAYLLSLFLSAIMIVPFLEFLAYTAIWEERTVDMVYSMPISGLMTLFFGNYFTTEGWQPSYIGFHFSAMYIGVSTLPLIIFAAIKAWRPLLPWLVIAVITLLLFFDIGPFLDGLRMLPLFSHLPMFYWVVVITFAFSMMAAWGWHYCLNAVFSVRSVIFSCLALVVIVWAMALFWQPQLFREAMITPELVDQYVNKHSLIVTLVFVVVTAIMLFAKRYPRQLSVLLITLLFADLWWVGHDWNPAAIPEHVFPQETPQSVAFLHQQSGPFRILGLNNILKPSTNMLVNLEEVRGYDVPVSQRYHRFFKQALHGDVSYWVYEKTKLETADLAYLNLLNVQYILSKNELMEHPNLDLVYDKEIKIYKNQDAEARLFTRYKSQYVADDEDALTALLAAPDRLHDTVIIEGEQMSLRSQSEPDVGHNSNMKFRIKQRDARQLQAEVEMVKDGWLVRSAAFYPGWKAYVDNHQVPVHAANYVLQAVWLPAGVHQVRFSYQPWSFTLGWIISLFSILGVIWILIKNKK